MSRPVYRRGGPYAARTRQLLRLAVHPELDSSQDRYTLALIQSIREKLTERELQCLTGYYVQRLPLAELGPRLGINPSTVSRNIHRGEEKLWQVIELADKISPCRLPEIMLVEQANPEKKEAPNA